MDLIDHEDDVPLFPDLLDETFHTALKLAAELCSRHKRRKIQQIDFLVLQLEGNISRNDALGQSFGDGGLSDAGLADETGVVLLTSVQDLDHPLQFLLTADHPVQFALPGALIEIDAVVVQELPLSPAVAGGFPPLGGVAVFLGTAPVGLVFPSASLTEQMIQERERRRLPLVVVSVRIITGGREIRQILHAGEGIHHISRQCVQVIVRQTHLLDDVIHRFDMHLPCTAQAESLLLLYTVFDFRNEDHSNVLAALCAHGWIHIITMLLSSMVACRSLAAVFRFQL